MIYLRADEVQDMNAHFVGPHALRDFALLDGAVKRPQARIFGRDAFPTPHQKAGALLHGISRAHPFIDGNKRTAWAACATFSLLNGYHIHAGQDDIVALVLDTAKGNLDVLAIADALESWAVPPGNLQH